MQQRRKIITIEDYKRAWCFCFPFVDTIKNGIAKLSKIISESILRKKEAEKITQIQKKNSIYY